MSIPTSPFIPPPPSCHLCLWNLSLWALLGAEWTSKPLLCFFLFSTCCCDCPPPTGTENDSSWPLPLNMVHPLLQGECSQEPRRSPRSIPAFRSSSLDTRSACPCSHGTANPVAGPPALGTVSPENFLLVLFRDSSGLCLSPAVSCGGIHLSPSKAYARQDLRSWPFSENCVHRKKSETRSLKCSFAEI